MKLSLLISLSSQPLNALSIVILSSLIFSSLLSERSFLKFSSVSFEIWNSKSWILLFSICFSSLICLKIKLSFSNILTLSFWWNFSIGFLVRDYFCSFFWNSRSFFKILITLSWERSFSLKSLSWTPSDLSLEFSDSNSSRFAFFDRSFLFLCKSSWCSVWRFLNYQYCINIDINSFQFSNSFKDIYYSLCIGIQLRYFIVSYCGFIYHTFKA